MTPRTVEGITPGTVEALRELSAFVARVLQELDGCGCRDFFLADLDRLRERAEAALQAESLTVAHSTGKSPRELAEDRDSIAEPGSFKQDTPRSRRDAGASPATGSNAAVAQTEERPTRNRQVASSTLAGGFIPIPEDAPPKYSGTGARCDMLLGACSCGAWHQPTQPAEECVVYGDLCKLSGQPHDVCDLDLSHPRCPSPGCRLEVGHLKLGHEFVESCAEDCCGQFIGRIGEALPNGAEWSSQWCQQPRSAHGTPHESEEGL